jgi:exonuclease SbcD
MIPAKVEGTFRLLHTADWHLGKLLNEQSRDEEHARFLIWLLGIVEKHAVDAVILAGDVFDSANPPQSALERYFNFVSSLHRQGGDCSLVVIAGNHDSAAQLEAPKQVLRALNVHVVGFLADKPDARFLFLPNSTDQKVAIAMMPFLRDRDLRVGKAGEGVEEIRAKIVAGIRQRYAETAEAAKLGATCPIMATGHLTVLGAAPSDSERDIHIGGLGAVTSDTFPDTFGYVALGHLHRPQTTDEQGRVRYAGSPIALSFSEANDAKEVRILDVSAKGITQFGLPIPLFRRLAQIRTSVADLESDLRKFDSAPGELQTWVEVVIEDATLDDDLNERVCKMARDLGVQVLKVLRGRPASGIGMRAGDPLDPEAIETLLDHPVQVFDHLLKHHEQLDASEAEKLKTTFARLMEMDRDAQAESI